MHGTCCNTQLATWKCPQRSSQPSFVAKKKRKKKEKAAALWRALCLHRQLYRTITRRYYQLEKAEKWQRQFPELSRWAVVFLFLFSRRAHVYLVTFVSCHGAARLVHRSYALFDLEWSTPRSWKDECIHTRRVAGLPRSARPTAPCDDGTRRHTRKRVQVTCSLCCCGH